MHKDIRVNVLMTTHSRGLLLSECLNALSTSARVADVALTVFLANSGTSQSGLLDTHLSERVNIIEIQVPSDSFWANSMRVASEVSWVKESESDYVLWLNDDTLLEPKAIRTLLDASLGLDNQAIVVGSCKSLANEWSYGGKRRRGKILRLHFDNVWPSSDSLVKCDTFNGNCVFFSRSVDHRLGGFPKGFSHHRADFVFGLMASKKRISSFVAPGYLARCEVNLTYPNFNELKGKGLRKRLHFISNPKVGPFGEHLSFCLKYGGLLGPVYALHLLVRAFVSK
jgi:GT2 family glycosyltransferase